VVKKCVALTLIHGELLKSDQCKKIVKKTTKMQNLNKQTFETKMLVKDGLMTKNGPIDFAQSLASCMKKSNCIYGEEKIEGRFAFCHTRCM
jgi:hypothetical protein